jgi:hypothetical protein
MVSSPPPVIDTVILAFTSLVIWIIKEAFAERRHRSAGH